MFDMHMHSVYSDGSDDLENLIENVSDSRIDFFALTDHDTAEGDRRIFVDDNLQKIIHERHLTFVPGIEISCRYKGVKMHILAYDFNPSRSEVFEIEQKMKDLLAQREIEKKQLMEKDGYVFSEKSLKFLASRLNARTLDFANCLVDDGYFDDVQKAATYVSKELKTKVNAKLDAEFVIKSMSKIGAKMVWAHSIYGVGEKPKSFELVDELVGELKEFGLAGLECYYSLYSNEEIDRLKKIAKKHGLFITCGSDYHGKNKSVKIGQLSSDGTKVNENDIKLDEIFINNVVK